MKNKSQQVTVSLRVSVEIRDFYMAKAIAERRRLTDVIRLALEDHVSISLKEIKPVTKIAAKK